VSIFQLTRPWPCQVPVSQEKKNYQYTDKRSTASSLNPSPRDVHYPLTLPSRNSCGRRSRPRRTTSFAAVQHLEPVLQGRHVRVNILVHLKGVRYDFDGPSAWCAVATGLEAEPEVAGVLWEAAEGVHEAGRVGFAVVLEPQFCEG